MYSSAWLVGNLFDSLSRWSVPIFVMVSGALLLSGAVETDIRSFYRRRATRLLPPLVFWTMFYIFLQQRGGHGPTAIAVFKSVVTGTPYFHLWYLYMLVGLYLITPFLHHIVIASSSRAQLFFIASTFAIAAIETSLIHLTAGKPTTFLSSFLPYVAYFVAGHYLYVQAKDEWSRKLYFLLAVLCGVLVAFATGALLTVLGPKSWEVMYSYLNPIVIVMSICIFRLCLGFNFSSCAVSALLHRIAPITLGIYLIHPFWLIVLGKFGLTPFLLHPAVGIPLTTVAAFCLSAVSAEFIAAIPLLRATVK